MSDGFATPLPSLSKPRPGKLGAARGLVPGLLLCGAATLAATLLRVAEERLFGRAWLEALVLAILIGTAVRTAWTPGERWERGVAFGAKTLLEVAVVLLGASISLQTLVAVGPALLAGIAGVVAIAIASSYGIGRALRLPRRMAILVACGNSAIAAIAPVIGADDEDQPRADPCAGPCMMPAAAACRGRLLRPRAMRRHQERAIGRLAGSRPLRMPYAHASTMKNTVCAKA